MNYAELLGQEPGEVAQPTTAEEAAAFVARAAAEGRAVLPWGAGTGQDYGYAPRRADVVLDLSRMNRIVAHEPGDLTVTVEAGATLADVQATLAAHGQFLPLDPPHADRATMGGILATNASGPGRLGYGTARDWLIGLTVVDARGRLIRGGGKVVKNVTGYDLPKLHVGALGTLGVIVEATFKVAPRPESSRALLFNFASDGDGAAFVSRLHRETSPILSLLTEASPGRWGAFAFAGPRAVVDSEIERARAIAAACGLPLPNILSEGTRNPFSDAAGTTPLLLCCLGRASDAHARHEAVSQLSDWLRVDTLAGTGTTEAAAQAKDTDPAALSAQMIKWAKAQSLPITLLHAPLSLRTGDINLWNPLPASFALMKRMKETLDPEATLNPGRFVGRL